MPDLDPPYGFALRKNSPCLENEVSANETWSGIQPCCPEDTTFTNSSVCCPDEEDCTEDIINPPHCADESWDLFNNTRDDGFFCCLSGTKGFYHSDKLAVGCIDDSDAPTNSDYQFLSTYSTGAAATSTTVLTATSSTSTATATSEPEYDESTSPSTSNTGAIAGGVVGGVAGLAIILALLWCFMRRRSQKQASQEETPITKGPVTQPHLVQSSDIPSELHGQSYV
ncbi:uncharacterized protein ASPGLDRAFT_145212, partial [Aspergillus glaucus CBS 516.65]